MATLPRQVLRRKPGDIPPKFPTNSRIRRAIFPADATATDWVPGTALSYYRVSLVKASPVLEIVPRWEVPEVVAAPQPMPLSTDAYIAVPDADGKTPVVGPDDIVEVERVWRARDVRHCRLCAHCRIHITANARVADDGRAIVCVVEVPERLLPADEAAANKKAALWSERHNGPLPVSMRGGVR